MSSLRAELSKRFEALDLRPEEFGHSEHLAVAYEMLCKYSFIDATAKFANTIRQMAENAGAHDKFSTTMTIAYMGLIAERMETTRHTDSADFVSRNHDLLSKDILKQWYSPDRLNSHLARILFLLPDLPRKP